MSTINRSEATKSAHLTLASMGPVGEIVLQEGRTLERDFGWVFFPVSRRYLETGDSGDLIPGVGPIAVDRVDGTATFLTTSIPPDVAIAAYEAAWRERRGGR